MEDIAPLFAQAVFLQQKEHYDDAITLYGKIIGLKPDWDWPYNNRGLAYDEKGQYDRAISDYNRAIEINPRFAGAYNNRAVAYYFKGEYDKAWNDVHKAQSLGYQVHPGFLRALREASGRQR